MSNTYMQKAIDKVDVSEVTKKYDSISELNQWGQFALQAGLIPQGTSLPQAMAIIQCGKEIGLRPMQSLRSMNFIKGRLTMSVQLQLALAKQRGVKIVSMNEETNSCEITLERNGETITCTYTLEDAKKAGLIKQDGNYEKYLKQMLRWRATGDCLRMIAPDLVMGLLSPEEAESIESFAPVCDKQVPTQPAQSTPQQEPGISAGAIGMVTGIRKETKTNRTTKAEFIVYHIKLDNDIEYTASGKDAESKINFANDARKHGLRVTLKTKGDTYNTITAIDTIEPDFSDPAASQNPESSDLLSEQDDINEADIPY